MSVWIDLFRSLNYAGFAATTAFKVDVSPQVHIMFDYIDIMHNFKFKLKGLGISKPAQSVISDLTFC